MMKYKIGTTQHDRRQIARYTAMEFPIEQISRMTRVTIENIQAFIASDLGKSLIENAKDLGYEPSMKKKVKREIPDWFRGTDEKRLINVRRGFGNKHKPVGNQSGRVRVKRGFNP